MATVRDIVTQALTRSTVVDAAQTPSAADIAAGLNEYNAMLFAWKAHGVDVNHATQALNDTFLLDDMHQDGVIFLLAQRLSNLYGEVLSRETAIGAKRGWNALLADYHFIDPLRQDPSLARTPSQRRADYAT